MKIRVKIDKQSFEVEVGDLTSRPIVAIVDGESFEIWPEEDETASVHLRRSAMPTISVPQAQRVEEKKPGWQNPEISSEEAGSSSYGVRAPLPGVIVAINVFPSSEVGAGQELCKLEAMKMNNSIRSSRAGKIKSVLVSVGQTVRHNEILMEFE
jgi:biotin carboxyl carrier protein